jgi:tRNA(fMet)-specific endonuclease VapC
VALSYLLDTNVLSRLMREPRGTTAERLAEVGDDTVCTSVVVASELRFGALRRGSTRLTETVGRILAAIPVLALEAPADEHYASIRVHLERVGTPIGPNDLLIAAHARALGLVLVTEIAAELARVPDLVVENWNRR